MNKNCVLVYLVGVVCSCSALANSNWLTIVGDPLDAATGTIEIDPASGSFYGERRTMLLRVSRSQERTSTDGIVFRSYIASVEFDCIQRNARFLAADFYQQSLWHGTPHKNMVYGPSQVRPVAFRFFEPNPLEKLVQAACPKVNGRNK